MYDYRAPLRDFEFTYFELFNYARHLTTLRGAEALRRDDVMSVLTAFARLCEQELVPLNAPSDRIGVQLADGVVTTPPGFREAYQRFVEGGWPALSMDERFEGQGLPESLSFVLHEMATSACVSWYTYPALAHGAKNTLAAHGSAWQQSVFLGPLVRGEWLATMCLTEPQCGSDLSQVRTQARPLEDGRYALHGTKIFITAGEHDLTPNIVHIVLARLPDAPAGTRGISLFIVPKVNVDAEGHMTDRNRVRCDSVEHKMGLKASATCVLTFDGATGYLIGEPHRGLQAMFTFMNTARLSTAVQGVSHAELGLQKAAGYARDRLAMRAPGGAQNPEAPADPIIVHPDVRRMLLTQKAIAEGGRMMVAYGGLLIDVTERSPDPEAARQAGELLAFLTPVAKAFLTETGFESASLAVQCFGGHGYISEWNVEQNLRDSRIAMLYEGTTGIQALDLLGRKVLANDGRTIALLAASIRGFCQQAPRTSHALALDESLGALEHATQVLSDQAKRHPEVVGAASVDYLMYWGYLLFGWLWAQAARRAQQMLDEGQGDPLFLRAKIQTADFYFGRMLPRTRQHGAALASDAALLMSMPPEAFLRQV